MNILVTGTSGHLGEALARTLIEADHRVTGLDIKAGPYTTILGSVTDAACVASAMSGVTVVYHAATLHKPHVETHDKQQFVDTNIQGTLNLLEAAVAQGIKSFVFTSTTSLFGDALRPPLGEPAAWITESVAAIPKNIYGVTKTAAEDLCHLFHRQSGLNCIILRTSRFFPEEDDDALKREALAEDNDKVNELLFRRADISDMVSAHIKAASCAPALGFGRYIISGASPFVEADLPMLRTDAPAVLRKYFPEYEAVYKKLGWQMFPGIDRVYVNHAAMRDLDWQPEYHFAEVLARLRRGEDYRSPLARVVGAKGYHAQVFEDGPYPVA